jgi:hypothetical protein
MKIPRSKCRDFFVWDVALELLKGIRCVMTWAWLILFEIPYCASCISIVSISPHEISLGKCTIPQLVKLLYERFFQHTKRSNKSYATHAFSFCIRVNIISWHPRTRWIPMSDLVEMEHCWMGCQPFSM